MAKQLFLSLFLVFGSITVKAQWIELGINSMNANNLINTVCVDPQGNVYAAGTFMDSNRNYYVSKWDGTTWSELGADSNALNANAMINSICSDYLGNIYAAGYFIDSTGKEYVAKWNGKSWIELGGTGANALNNDGTIYSICTDVFGNVYTTTSSVITVPYSGNIAKWDGNSWTQLGTGASGLNANEVIYSICTDDSGNVYAAGEFTNKTNDTYVAKWNGSSWTELGTTNILHSGSSILSICIDKNRNVYAAGNFFDSTSKCFVAKWNGTIWSELGAGSTALYANSSILSICTDSSGNVYAAGAFTDSNGSTEVEKWDGASWSEVGGANALNTPWQIRSICIDNQGGIYAAGEFFTDSPFTYYVAKYQQNSVTGVAPIANSAVSVYPNPTNGSITIASPQSGQAVVYNSLGEVITTQNLQVGNSTVSLDKVSTGIYTIVLPGTSNSYTTLKVIKN